VPDNQGTTKAAAPHRVEVSPASAAPGLGRRVLTTRFYKRLVRDSLPPQPGVGLYMVEVIVNDALFPLPSPPPPRGEGANATPFSQLSLGDSRRARTGYRKSNAGRRASSTT
jgi:hypothetical protein